MGAPGRQPQAVGVGEPLVLGPQRHVLPRLRVEGLDALEPGLEDVDLAGAFVRRCRSRSRSAAAHESASNVFR